MRAKRYTLGHTVEIVARFRNHSEELFDPPVVEAWALPPGGDTETADVEQQATGVYLIRVDGDVEGTWYVRVEGIEGNVVKAAETSFCIVSRSVPAEVS